MPGLCKSLSRDRLRTGMCAAEPEGPDFRRVPRGALRARCSRLSAALEDVAVEAGAFDGDAVAVAGFLRRCDGAGEVVREEQAYAARDFVVEEPALLVDQ